MPRMIQCNEWVSKGLVETCAAENCMAGGCAVILCETQNVAGDLLRLKKPTFHYGPEGINYSVYTYFIRYEAKCTVLITSCRKIINMK